MDLRGAARQQAARSVRDGVDPDGGLDAYGGTAGFAVASENDAPLAAKAQNIGLAFLAFDMRCARCHDAPSHDFSQEDLFNLAAMLHRGEQTLPKTSTIPGDDKDHASLLVKVSLKPGQKIAPRWPFEDELRGDLPKHSLPIPNDPREELAAANHLAAQSAVCAR